MMSIHYSPPPEPVLHLRRKRHKLGAADVELLLQGLVALLSLVAIGLSFYLWYVLPMSNFER